MLGAVAGDIIGSPYSYVNAEDRYFDIGKGVRGWSHGREVTFHPRITDESIATVNMMANIFFIFYLPLVKTRFYFWISYTTGSS